MARAVNSVDVDEMIRLTTDDVVIIVGRSEVEGPFVGHDGVRELFADTAESFDLFELHADEVCDVGDDQVLSTGVVRVRGRGGGVEATTPFAGITTFRDGKACRWEDFRERSLALKAAGAEE